MEFAAESMFASCDFAAIGSTDGTNDGYHSYMVRFIELVVGLGMAAALQTSPVLWSKFLLQNSVRNSRRLSLIPFRIVLYSTRFVHW